MVSLISWNVNGLTNPIKRDWIFTALRQYDAQIATIQETHLNEIEHEKLTRRGYILGVASHYTGARKRCSNTYSPIPETDARCNNDR